MDGYGLRMGNAGPGRRVSLHVGGRQGIEHGDVEILHPRPLEQFADAGKADGRLIETLLRRGESLLPEQSSLN